MSWRRFLRRGRWDAERAAEMEAHLDLLAADLVAGGMTPEAARREARLRFGNPAAVREEIYEMNSLPVLETLARDARFTLRLLRKRRSFTLTAVGTLGLAIAVNAAVFSVVDGVLLRPLPFAEPERLGVIAPTRGDSGPELGVTPDGDTWGLAVDGVTWEAVRDQGGRAFDRAVFSSWSSGVNLLLPRAGGAAEARHVRQQRVGTGFFRVLGTRPLLGREFLPEEDHSGGAPVVMLSAELWRAVGADPRIVGRTVRLRGEPHTVVGVMPDGFRTGTRADVWTPLRPSTTGEGEGANYQVLTRLREGAAPAQAEREVAAIGAELDRRRPAADGVRRGLALLPLREAMTAGLRRPLLALWGAVGLVLLVACLNLAGLVLVQVSGRTRELATRLAIGSSRGAILRQLLVESCLVALLGGALGVALGRATLAGLQRLARGAYDLWQPVSLDGRAVAAALALSLAASLLFGLAPALHAARLELGGALRGTASRIAGAARHWPRRVFVVGQVALVVVLLVLAGLLLRSFAYLQGLSAGFSSDGVQTAAVTLDDTRYGDHEAVTRLLDRAVAEMRRRPGVEAAAASLGLPYQRPLNLGFHRLDGSPADQEDRGTCAAYVTPDFFRALRIPLRAGRAFDDRDRADGRPVAIVNEAFARAFFPGDDPVGRRIAIAQQEREIVGVVGDVQVKPSLRDGGPLVAEVMAYVPAAQVEDETLRIVHGWFPTTFVTRTRLSDEAAASAMRQALDAVDPLLPFAEVRPMREVRAAALAPQRFLMVVLGSLAAVTLLLAALGLHGLVAATVTERWREMAIRVALGSTRRRAVRQLVLPGLLLAGAGALLGVALALGATRLAASLVWGVRITDPWTFGGVGAVIVAVAAVASLASALRVLRQPAALALRQD